MKIITLFCCILYDLMIVFSEVNSNKNENSFSRLIKTEKTLIDKIKMNLSKNSLILSNLEQFINLKSEV